MADKKSGTRDSREETIRNIQQIDSVVQQTMKSISMSTGATRTEDEFSQIYNQFSDLVRKDTYNISKIKSTSQNSINFIANALAGVRTPNMRTNLSPKEQALDSRIRLENIFNNGDAQAASLFVNQSSDIFHIYDEIESICAYLYQLDEAILILRDNVLNAEQQTDELPFDITFTSTTDKSADYVKIAKEVWIDSGMNQKLNDHLVPNTLKYGRHYLLTIPYSEIGVRIFAQKKYGNGRTLFDGVSNVGVLNESSDNGNSSQSYTLEACMENVDALFENIEWNDKLASVCGTKDKYMNIIKENIGNLYIDDSDTPPNITGISEATLQSIMTDKDLQAKVNSAVTNMNKLFSANIRATKKGNEDKHISDTTMDISDLENIAGSFNKVVDPRLMHPIKIFEHVIGYYYFENYNFARTGTTITDLLSNQMNFEDNNMIVDQIVNGILSNLKYGDVLQGNNDFKSMVLNCILFAERRTNPLKIKFVPTDFVTEYKTNCDANGNGQPVLLRSLVYGRLYVSMLMFMITTIITKSTDTEFYYLRENLLSQDYEDQVADILEQFRNSNIDISQIINGNLLHGNRAINKRYFLCTGSQDIKPFDVEVVSGQNVDIHNDLLTDLKKMAIGSAGIPSIAIDMMDEIEFATILKMSSTKVLTRANNTQKDLNPSITESMIKLCKYNRPNAIPDDVLNTCRCELRKNNTINNNISADEINNVIAIADSMVETFYKGNETELPEELIYEKEEMRKRLIMIMAKSLPWGYMESIRDDVKISARLQKQENDARKNNTDTTA